MEQTYMKEKPILPLLLSMAAPMILSMLVNSLYNIIDSIFVAKISEDAMTALSLVFPIQNVVNSVAVGFGIGINVMIAFCLGANQREQADKAASQGNVSLYCTWNYFKYNRHPHYAFILKTVYEQSGHPLFRITLFKYRSSFLNYYPCGNHF